MIETTERMRAGFCALLMLAVVPGIGFAAHVRSQDSPTHHARSHSTYDERRHPAGTRNGVRKTWADRTTWDSVYTPDQAKRGQTAYNATCAKCHQESLGGADEAPALTGSTFMSNWNTLALSELHERVRTTMPPDAVGTYEKQQITDVIAYILKFNGFPAGAVELTHENDALKTIKFVSAKP